MSNEQPQPAAPDGEERRPRLVVISGLSGAGKSVALHTLEDLGFYCVDNLPVALLGAFADQILGHGRDDYFRRTAVGIDARNSPQDLGEVPRTVAELRAKGIACEIFYLHTDDDTLYRRYSETRRKHPLTRDGRSLAEAIRLEHKVLEPIAAAADLRIDTSRTNLYQLRGIIVERVAGQGGAGPSLLFQSFAYKNGVPADVDFVFDARCLPNPYWVPALRGYTGLDASVREFLEAEPVVGQAFAEVCGFLEAWLPRFEASSRAYITVAVGCTGGQHRSVYLVERLAEHFRRSRPNVLIRHRELS